MQKAVYIKRVLSVVFTAMVLFTVNVHQIHFLFAEHHVHHDECDNHLHSEDEHTHCEICQFDISLLDDQISTQRFSILIAFHEVLTVKYAASLWATQRDYVSLRGPPTLV